MEKRHIINLQGRDFVTYEGLLDEAHSRGLRSIRTVLVQVPTEQNGNIAICQAEVELVENGEVTGEVNNFRFNESPVGLLGRAAEAGRTEKTLPREWSDWFTRAAMPALRIPDFNMSSVSRGV